MNRWKGERILRSPFSWATFYIATGGSLEANNGNQVIMNVRHGIVSTKHGESSLFIIFFVFFYSSYEIVQPFFRPFVFVVLPEINFQIKTLILILPRRSASHFFSIHCLFLARYDG